MADDICTTLLSIATAETGVKETPGKASTSRIDEYLKATRGPDSGDETPWCSAFAAWVVAKAGLKGTGSRAARSWLKWGKAIDAPIPGCVVVLWRENPRSVKGHVAFYVGKDARGRLKLLGGNQGNAVSVSLYAANRVLGFRVPL